MKEQIKAFFEKKNPYYSPSEEIEENKEPTKKEFKKLEKENKHLKQDFFKQLTQYVKTRRSVRSYSQAKIDEATIYDCIDAALNVPSAGNIANYRVILIKDPEAKNEIGRIALNQFWISEAPMIAVVVRNDLQLNQLYPQFGDRYSLQNTAAFIDTFILLIHAAGYATCWVEACEEGVLKEYLKIPESQFIDAILPIGYPLEIPTVEKVGIQDICYFEKFKQKNK